MREETPSNSPVESHGPQPADRAWRRLSCHLRLWIVLAAVLAADLASKQAVFRWLGEPPDRSSAPTADASKVYTVIDGWLQLRTQYNRGAALGILQGWGVAFVVAGIASLGLFIYLFARSDRRQWFFQIGIGLVLAGALGNIYDRLMFPMQGVRDFIHVTLTIGARPVYPWIFNVADMALVVGIAMIMLSWIRQSARARRVG